MGPLKTNQWEHDGDRWGVFFEEDGKGTGRLVLEVRHRTRVLVSSLLLCFCPGWEPTGAKQ